MKRSLILILLLAGCTTTRVKRDEPQRIAVPVATGCVSGARPDRVAPLIERLPEPAWRPLTPRQKAAHVAAQGLRHQSHGQLLAAATGGCR